MTERPLCEGCNREKNPPERFKCPILETEISKDYCLKVRKGKIDLDV